MTIKDQLEGKEGGFAHFKARLVLMGDHTMRVEWSRNRWPATTGTHSHALPPTPPESLAVLSPSPS